VEAALDRAEAVRDRIFRRRDPIREAALAPIWGVEGISTAQAHCLPDREGERVAVPSPGRGTAARSIVLGRESVIDRGFPVASVIDLESGIGPAASVIGRGALPIGRPNSPIGRIGRASSIAPVLPTGPVREIDPALSVRQSTPAIAESRETSIT
jgi:hypothetical protein